MDDILTDNIEIESSPVVRPEDDFDSFVSMISNNGTSKDKNEEDADELPNIPVPEDELPPSLRNKKEEIKEDSDEDNDEDDEDPPVNDKEEGESDDDSSEGEYGDLEVSLDTIITLPDGTERSIEDLTKGYSTLAELTEREQALAERATTMESKAGRIDEALSLAKLEADDVLEKFEGFDWGALLQENPEEYGKTKMFVERYEKRSKDLRNLMSERTAKAEEEKGEELQRQATSCVTTLTKEIPGWNSNLYNDILAYAVEKGTSEAYIKQCTDAGILKAFYTAMKVEKGEDIVRAKIRRGTASPTRTLKAGGTKTPVKKNVNTTGLMGREADEFSTLSSILNR